MLRLLQNVLFVCGATATALAAGAGIAFLAGLMIFPSDRDSGGAVAAFVLLTVSGGGIGAIAGLTFSIRRITRPSITRWPLATWIGAAAGLVTGITARASGAFDGHVIGDLIEWLPGMIVFLASSVFLGGCMGTCAKFIVRRLRTGS